MSGGGVHLDNGTLIDTLFTQNQSTTDAGGAAGDGHAEGCTFAENKALSGLGGGWYIEDYTTVVNCTFSMKTGSEGAGLYLSPPGLFSSPELHLESVTIAYNNGPGMGTVGEVSQRVPLSILRVLISNNDHSEDIALSLANLRSHSRNLIGKVSADYESDLLGSDQWGSDSDPLEPWLAPLTDQGGFTPTHALYAGSLAKDTGGVSALTTDQRGMARPAGAATDIGAYESGETLYLPYETWAERTIGDPAIAGIIQDADDDGIVNAIEFLTGTLPEDGVSTPEFRAGQEADDSAFFEVNLAGYLDPATVLVKWSDDMSDWKTSALTQSIVDHVLKVTYSRSEPINRLFWRMEYQ